MELFKRLHGRLEPPGLELLILRKLPRVTLLGTLIPVVLSVLVRVLPQQASVDTAKHIRSVDIFAIATTVTFWTAVFTVAIGCVVVHVMKGPAYVADPYPLEHADQPDTRDT